MTKPDGVLEPFHVNVSDEQLSSLQRKLANVSLPEEIEDAAWDYGVPLDTVKRLTDRWTTVYDWRDQERRINALPQYLREIEVDGFGAVSVHFIYQKSLVSGAIPLLFVHGWPGLYLEVAHLLQGLTDNTHGGPNFHVVAPSLLNFGFSQAIRKRGFSIRQYAELCQKLMLSLGYMQYITQGGDWGYMVTRMLGYLYPSSCVASHTNMTPFGPPNWRNHPILFLQTAFNGLFGWSKWDSAALARLGNHASQGNGYVALQSTKPQTLAYALADSPVALLAWIVEKLYAWTDAYPWTDDELLTWVSVYWFSNSGPAAHVQIYYEFAHDQDQATLQRIRSGWIPHVKYGVAFFPQEPIACPKFWVHQMGNVVHQSEADRGGHFPGIENPSFITDDLRNMFGKGGGAYGVVPGKDGY